MPRRIPADADLAPSGRGTSSRAASSTPPPARTAVIYIRVSSKDQEKEGYSLPAQQALLRAYAADKGFAVAQDFVDVETAKKAGRTSFGQMITWLRRHKTCRTILSEKTDRLYRNFKDYVDLDELNLEIHLVKEGTVLSEESRSADKFMHGIRLVMAKNYIDNLSEEVRKGMRQKAEEGHWPNPAPVGYLNQRTGGRSLLVLDRDRAPLVKQLFEQYDTGRFSVEDLRDWCVRVGLMGKHGRPLAPSTILAILRNPLYGGRFSWDGTVYDSKDPTLISWGLFERVQDRLDGFPYTRATDRGLPFMGLLTCGHCGAAITGEVKKERYTYYRCAKNCTKEPYLREEGLVELFGEHLKRLRLPDPWLKMAIDELKSSRQGIKSDIDARMAIARQRYDRLGARIEKAWQDRLDGLVVEDLYLRKSQEWEGERADALAEMERLSAADHANLDFAVTFIELGKGAYEQYSRLDRPQQREVLDLVFQNSRLAGGIVEVTWREPFSFLANLGDASPKTKTPSGVPEGVHSGWWAILDSNQ